MCMNIFVFLRPQTRPGMRFFNRVYRKLFDTCLSIDLPHYYSALLRQSFHLIDARLFLEAITGRKDILQQRFYCTGIISSEYCYS